VANVQTVEKDLTREDIAESLEETQPSLIDWKSLWMPMLFVVGIFLAAFYLPMESKRFTNAVLESLALVNGTPGNMCSFAWSPRFHRPGPSPVSYPRLP